MGEPAAKAEVEDARAVSPVHELAYSIERTFHAQFVNRLANEPGTVEWLQGYHQLPLDFTEVTDNEDNIVLVGEHGAAVFAPTVVPTIYEYHMMVQKEHRGEWSKLFAQACFLTIFTRTTCMELLARIPKGNLGSRTMANLLGFSHERTQPNGWVVDLDPVPVDWFSLRIEDWLKTASGLAERGRWFFERLESDLRALGAEGDLGLPDSEECDRHTGGAIEMLFGGQIAKAEVFFNRWSVMAGRHPIKVVNPRPLLLDTGAIVIRIEDNDFAILKVK
jgi:hypothetical protein